MCMSDLRHLKCLARRVINSSFALPSTGGDLSWAGPGTFDPEFEKQLDALNEGEISQPFKTQFGWHIVQLLGRRVHDISDDMRRAEDRAIERDERDLEKATEAIAADHEDHH